MSPIAGFVRLRKHQFGRQATFGTKVAATRAYPYRGVPAVDLAWTDPEVDAGSIDLVAAPYRGAPDLTLSGELPSLTYNDLTQILCHFFGGNVSPTGGGASKTWTHEPSSDTVDVRDVATYEFGETDVTSDWFQLGDGIIESFEITGPEGKGALTASTSWRFGSVASTSSTDSPVTGTVPTPGLSVATDDAVIYLKDGAIYIASDPDDLSTSKISDAFHTFTFRGSQEVDQKRFADGDQTFDIDAYGPGARTLELEATFAKSEDIVGTGSESDAWLSDEAVTRYIRLGFISKVKASTGPDVFYSWTVTMPMRYYTRTEGEIGQNVTVVLTARAFFDDVEFEGVLKSVLVNTLTEAELGEASS